MQNSRLPLSGGPEQPRPPSEPNLHSVMPRHFPNGLVGPRGDDRRNGAVIDDTDVLPTPLLQDRADDRVRERIHVSARNDDAAFHVQRLEAAAPAKSAASLRFDVLEIGKGTIEPKLGNVEPHRAARYQSLYAVAYGRPKQEQHLVEGMNRCLAG